jgi:hypothetical protein
VSGGLVKFERCDRNTGHAVTPKKKYRTTVDRQEEEIASYKFPPEGIFGSGHVQFGRLPLHLQYFPTDSKSTSGLGVW